MSELPYRVYYLKDKERPWGGGLWFQVVAAFQREQEAFDFLDRQRQKDTEKVWRVCAGRRIIWENGKHREWPKRIYR